MEIFENISQLKSKRRPTHDSQEYLPRSKFQRRCKQCNDLHFRSFSLIEDIFDLNLRSYLESRLIYSIDEFGRVFDVQLFSPIANFRREASLN